MVRELSKHQSASCLIVVFFIARFASLSCYSSAKTRIRPVKSDHYGHIKRIGWDSDVMWVSPSRLTNPFSVYILDPPSLKWYSHWGNWQDVGKPNVRFHSAHVCATRKGNAICRIPEGPLNEPVQGKTRPPSMVLYDNIDVCSFSNSTDDTISSTYLEWLDFHTFSPLEAGNIWDDWEQSGTTYVYGRNITTTRPENINPLWEHIAQSRCSSIMGTANPRCMMTHQLKISKIDNL